MREGVSERGREGREGVREGGSERGRVREGGSERGREGGNKGQRIGEWKSKEIHT